MRTGRLEAFSDGVLAILITIMVLELRVPHSAELHALEPLVPVFLSYVLSFVYLGIYWNNHHHLFQATTRISGGTLWANLNLLFWLSLFPFVTGWMGENHAATVPTIVYGCVLLMAALSFYLLQSVIVAVQGPDSMLAAALGRDVKGKISPVLYVVAICVALVANTTMFVAFGVMVSVRSNLPFPLLAAFAVIPSIGLVSWMTLRLRDLFKAMVLSAFILMAVIMAALMMAMR